MGDWDEQARDRRDFRQAKDVVRPVSVSKRNTKRWCRGKVGAEHQTKCVPYAETKLTYRPWQDGWRLLVCETCGKELDWYYPSGFNRRNKPEWVTS